MYPTNTNLQIHYKLGENHFNCLSFSFPELAVTLEQEFPHQKEISYQEEGDRSRLTEPRELVLVISIRC